MTYAEFLLKVLGYLKDNPEIWDKKVKFDAEFEPGAYISYDRLNDINIDDKDVIHLDFGD